MISEKKNQLIQVIRQKLSTEFVRSVIARSLVEAINRNSSYEDGIFAPNFLFLAHEFWFWVSQQLQFSSFYCRIGVSKWTQYRDLYPVLIVVYKLRYHKEFKWLDQIKLNSLRPMDGNKSLSVRKFNTRHLAERPIATWKEVKNRFGMNLVQFFHQHTIRNHHLTCSFAFRNINS